MKKHGIIALVTLAGVAVFWIGSVLFAGIFTVLHADEFRDFDAIDAGWLYNYGDEKEIRVIHYNRNCAKVYFYSETGGDYISFAKKDGQWKSDKTIASWSGLGGSADDYFVWPYFKDWVI